MTTFAPQDGAVDKLISDWPYYYRTGGAASAPFYDAIASLLSLPEATVTVGPESVRASLKRAPYGYGPRAVGWTRSLWADAPRIGCGVSAR